MKKFFLSIVVFSASAAYVAYQYLGEGGASSSSQITPVATPIQPAPVLVSTVASTSASQKTTISVPTQTPTPTPTQTQTRTPIPVPPPKPKGAYADGTYTGSVADAYYGMVQVKATIQGGALTDVTFLQYPSDRRTSQYINSQAMPQLRQEAIQAQSADVSGVSGASDTSAAFRESLANALAQAKN